MSGSKKNYCSLQYDSNWNFEIPATVLMWYENNMQFYVVDQSVISIADTTVICGMQAW